MPALLFRACLAVVLSIGSGAAAPAQAELLHRWKADGNAIDAVGDDDGELIGGATYTPSIDGQAFSFDGIDDAVQFGATAGNFGDSDFTIAFVIRTTSSGNIEAVLAKRKICGFSSFWDVRSNASGSLSLEVYETNVNRGITAVVPINDGLYHTVVFTREGTVMTSYVDGFERLRVDHGEAPSVSNDEELSAGIGACVAQDGTVPFTGLLDEIRLADHADANLLPAFFHCGDANKNAEVSATDALSALRTAVGAQACELCLCDTNDNGTVTSSDALAILRSSVGQQIPLLCQLCPFELID